MLLVPLILSLILLFAGAPCANAETGGESETQLTETDSSPVSTGTDARQDPPLPAAEQEPIPDDTPPPEAAIPPLEQTLLLIDRCLTVEVAGETWLDQVHGFVDRKLCQPAVWFDGFFGEDRVLETVRPTVFVNLKNSERWVENQGVDFIYDYRFRYRLPGLSKFLKKGKVYLVSETTADTVTVQPGQPIDPGIDPESGASKPIIGLRADFFTWLRSMVSINTGIKVQVPPDPFIRMRFQYTKPLGGAYLVRFTETALWRYVEHFTETTQVDFERIMTTFTLLRWSNYATYTEGTAGITWNSGISLLTQLTELSAISYDLSTWGVNHPDWVISNYRAGIKFRRNFYRPWLFLELIPEVTWPKDASGHRFHQYAFLATLEVQFGK